ncbi:HNH endonuclease family protein [Ferroglobus placidus]|uniref:HNH endonuclease family protein n=1 Tax=Ferroglobus placidus TaxID=54261 RepID=UPI000A050F8E
METITVEHILPRNPKGEWLNIFSEEEIKKIVNKLGNLTLLNKRRNSRASNYEYRKKLERYFDVQRNPFAITTMLRNYSSWDKQAFEKRHRELLNLVFTVYIPQNLV